MVWRCHVLPQHMSCMIESESISLPSSSSPEHDTPQNPLDELDGADAFLAVRVATTRCVNDLHTAYKRDRGDALPTSSE